MPLNPEIYFLSGRNPPFRYYNIEYGLRTADDVARITGQLDARPPALICYFPRDKRNSAYVVDVMRHVKAHYTFLGNISRFEIYLRPDVVQRGPGS